MVKARGPGSRATCRGRAGADLGFREGEVGVEIGARAKWEPENFD